MSRLREHGKNAVPAGTHKDSQSRDTDDQCPDEECEPVAFLVSLGARSAELVLASLSGMGQRRIQELYDFRGRNTPKAGRFARDRKRGACEQAQFTNSPLNMPIRGGAVAANKCPISVSGMTGQLYDSSRDTSNPAN